jgi:hypothetical protein
MTWIIALAAPLVLGNLPARAAITLPTPAPVVCNNQGYARNRRIVPTAEAARTIFLAVETAIFPGADKTGHPDVEVDEEPEFWIVFRTRTPAPGTIERGGGQLSLRIAKCDGAISDVYLSR